jgi:hypothetical protein
MALDGGIGRSLKRRRCAEGSRRAVAFRRPGRRQRAARQPSAGRRGVRLWVDRIANRSIRGEFAPRLTASARCSGPEHCGKEGSPVPAEAFGNREIGAVRAVGSATHAELVAPPAPVSYREARAGAARGLPDSCCLASTFDTRRSTMRVLRTRCSAIARCSCRRPRARALPARGRSARRDPSRKPAFARPAEDRATPASINSHAGFLPEDWHSLSSVTKRAFGPYRSLKWHRPPAAACPSVARPGRLLRRHRVPTGTPTGCGSCRRRLSPQDPPGSPGARARVARVGHRTARHRTVEHETIVML